MENMKSEFEQAETKSTKTKPQPENLMIPKHRFDCVNLALKETKEALRQKAHETEQDIVRIAELEKALLDAKIETALALHKAKNLTAVKALIDYSDLKLGQDGTVPEIEEQILAIKKSQSYLFEDEESVIYVLVPIKSGDKLNKSITDYIKGNRRTEK